MAYKFRTVYELMDWAALRFDLNPEQRKQLYGILESKNILKTSKSPGDEAVRIAREIARESKPKVASRKSSVKSEAPVRRSKPKTIDKDIDEEDVEEDADDNYDTEIDDSDGDDSRWEN
jgi:hypothetical protein